ncbi:nuclease-related domain-containing protein [Citricoccus nitrophenolicus]|uniref:nuclease-related domain-containing protein n=1 Tax=Citricoccus nitrophenolicus TaxID=863575 RepID=UPI0031F062FB
MTTTENEAHAGVPARHKVSSAGNVFGDDLPSMFDTLKAGVNEQAAKKAEAETASEQVAEAEGSTLISRVIERIKDLEMPGQRLPEISKEGEFFRDNQPEYYGPTYRLTILIMAILNTPIALFFLLAMLFSGEVPLAWVGLVWVPATAYTWWHWARTKNPDRLPIWTQARNVPTDKVPHSILNQRVHGVAGDLSSARGKFSDANIAAGEAGEKSSAKLMEPVSRLHGVRVFHGANWPGSDTADIDHILVSGEHMAIVDSKVWSGVYHRMGEDAQVISSMEDGAEVERKIHIQKAAQKLKEMFPTMTVRAYLAVHSSPGTRFHMSNGTPVYMASAVETMDEVTRFLKSARQYGTVHIPLIRELQLLVDNPLNVKHADIEAGTEYHSPGRFKRRR